MFVGVAHNADGSHGTAADVNCETPKSWPEPVFAERDHLALGDPTGQLTLQQGAEEPFFILSFNEKQMRRGVLDGIPPGLPVNGVQG